MTLLRSEHAFRLSQRFQMVYTLKKASWLNMAEIDISALSKQCLDPATGGAMSKPYRKKYMPGPMSAIIRK